MCCLSEAPAARERREKGARLRAADDAETLPRLASLPRIGNADTRRTSLSALRSRAGLTLPPPCSRRLPARRSGAPADCLALARGTSRERAPEARHNPENPMREHGACRAKKKMELRRSGTIFFRPRAYRKRRYVQTVSRFGLAPCGVMRSPARDCAASPRLGAFSGRTVPGLTPGVSWCCVASPRLRRRGNAEKRARGFAPRTMRRRSRGLLRSRVSETRIRDGRPCLRFAPAPV